MCGPLHTGWLTGFLMVCFATSAAATSIGISVHATFDANLVVIAQADTDAGESSQEPISSPPSSSDVTQVPKSPDPHQAALLYSPFSGGLGSANLAGLLSHLSPSFSLRQIADPHLNTTISDDGSLSISSGGDDLSGRGATRFRTGEARLPAAPTYGSFAVLVQFEPADGFLSGPFVSEATFSELYGALEEYDRGALQEAGVNVVRHATFP